MRHSLALPRALTAAEVGTIYEPHIFTPPPPTCPGVLFLFLWPRAAIDEEPGQGAAPPEGLRVPRDALRVYPGGQHAGVVAPQPRVLGVEAAHPG